MSQPTEGLELEQLIVDEERSPEPVGPSENARPRSLRRRVFNVALTVNLVCGALLLVFVANKCWATKEAPVDARSEISEAVVVAPVANPCAAAPPAATASPTQPANIAPSTQPATLAATIAPPTQPATLAPPAPCASTKTPPAPCEVPEQRILWKQLHGQLQMREYVMQRECTSTLPSSSMALINVKQPLDIQLPQFIEQLYLAIQEVDKIIGKCRRPVLRSSSRPFKPSVPYNQDYAITAALYSAIGYCPPWRVNAWSFTSARCKALGAGTPVTYEKSTSSKVTDRTFGYTAVDPNAKQIIVSFKGTNGSTADFLADIQVSVISGGDCIIAGTKLPGSFHPGFCRYYKGLADVGLAGGVQQLVIDNPTYELLVTGHSLGASIATICMLDLLYRLKLKPQRSVLYTFGEPRTGNDDSASWLEQNVDVMYRVTHRKDPIVHFPACFSQCLTSSLCGNSACSTSFSYFAYHHAQEIFYEAQNFPSNFKVCNGLGEDPSCAWGQWGLSVDDHLDYLGIKIASECCFT